MSLLYHPAISPRILQQIIRKIHHKELVRLARASTFSADVVDHFAQERLESYKYAREIEKKFYEQIKEILPDFEVFSKSDPKDELEYLKDILYRFLINVEPGHLGKDRFNFFNDTLLLLVRYIAVWDYLHENKFRL